MLHCQPGEILILRSAEDQDRNLGRGAKESVESFDSMAVRQEEVDQYRGDTVGSAPFFAGQSPQTRGAAVDPFDPKRPIVRIEQRLANGLGIGRVGLDQKYVLRHEDFLCHQNPSVRDSSKLPAQPTVR
jgi:hypothetical protein